MSGVRLKGISWDHPRGYEPLIAASAQWRETHGVEIVWDRHSLQHFESFPIDQLARGYDLMIIDHPHIGDAVATGSLAALDEPKRDCAALAAASVGPSYQSYVWQGRLWTLPVDTATQVQAYRPDLIGEAPKRWDDVLALARSRRVAFPLRPPHNLMTLYTLCANLGAPGRVEAADLFDREIGAQAAEMLSELAALVDPRRFAQDPIAVYEEVSGAESDIALIPFIYGYVSYARPGFRARVLKFADIVSTGRGPIGSALGGAGLAVSAFSAHAEAAKDFAYWVASGEVQRGLYAASGGQPAHADAWKDDAVNAAAGNFYRDTRATYDSAWLRPRHAGYLNFQRAGAERLNAGLQAKEKGAALIDALNRMYAENLSAAS